MSHCKKRHRFPLKTVGGTISNIVTDLSNKPEFSSKSKVISKGVGEFLNGSPQALANGTDFIIEKPTELGSNIGGEVSGKIAEANGAQFSIVQKIVALH